MRPGAHDVAVLSVNTPYRNLGGMNSGTPVSIQWSNQRGTGTFNGYVYRADPLIVAGASANTLICVGASFPLMGKGQNIWTDISASEVVRIIAAQHGLDYDVEDHPRVYNQITQAGESYWQLLNRLADETGYVLRMDGATLRFRSRKSFTQHYRPIAIRMDFAQGANPNLRLAAEVQEFKARVGAANPEFGTLHASRSGSGIDPASGEAISNSADVSPLRADGSPIFQDYITNRVVNSALELDLALQAEQEKNRFTKFAQMRTLGDPTLAPEKVVYVRGVDAPYNGFWTARTVVHDITTNNYRCEVFVATDGLGGPLRATGEDSYTIPDHPTMATVNPHRPGAFQKALQPVLVSKSQVIGQPGAPLTDWFWSAPVVRSVNV